MALLLFEDALVSQLAPITSARAACCMTVGSYHLIDLMRLTKQQLVCSTRRYLKSLLELDYADVQHVGDVALEAESGPTLILNARLIPSVQTLKIVEGILANA